VLHCCLNSPRDKLQGGLTAVQLQLLFVVWQQCVGVMPDLKVTRPMLLVHVGHIDGDQHKVNPLHCRLGVYLQGHAQCSEPQRCAM